MTWLNKNMHDRSFLMDLLIISVGSFLLSNKLYFTEKWSYKCGTSKTLWSINPRNFISLYLE
jgi:hypothetical protein